MASQQTRDTDKGVLDKAADAVRGGVDQAADLADRALEQGREAGAMVQQAPATLKDALDTSLTDRPMVTLAAAGVVGFVLGALWKS